MNQSKLLSFPQAIQATQSLMDKIDAQQLNELDIAQETAAIVSTKNGGRGFFVAYLTSDRSLPDKPSTGIIEGLKSSTDVVSELLVKNLAMSCAMTIAHSRNEDVKNTQGSQKVYQRTLNLIQHLDLDLLKQELQYLRNTIINKNGKYNDFLERWNYDLEQQQAIEKAITNALLA